MCWYADIAVSIWHLKKVGDWSVFIPDNKPPRWLTISVLIPSMNSELLLLSSVIFVKVLYYDVVDDDL